VEVPSAQKLLDRPWQYWPLTVDEITGTTREGMSRRKAQGGEEVEEEVGGGADKVCVCVYVCLLFSYLLFVYVYMCIRDMYVVIVFERLALRKKMIRVNI